jgi:predicted nucleic acid-binding protein
VTIYVDSSALLKRYLDEPDRHQYVDILQADPSWVSARHTYVEIRRALARELGPREQTRMRREFATDWAETEIVELDERTCDLAAELAESTGARTLDALHLAAAHRVGGGALSFVTADRRQALAARSLGWMVLGS